MAAMQFSCPHCSGLFQVDSSLGGQQVSCPHCRGVVVLPAMAGYPPPGAASAQYPGGPVPGYGGQEMPVRPPASVPGFTPVGPGQSFPPPSQERPLAPAPGFPPQPQAPAGPERPLAGPQPQRPFRPLPAGSQAGGLPPGQERPLGGPAQGPSPPTPQVPPSQRPVVPQRPAAAVAARRSAALRTAAQSCSVVRCSDSPGGTDDPCRTIQTGGAHGAEAGGGRRRTTHSGRASAAGNAGLVAAAAWRRDRAHARGNTSGRSEIADERAAAGHGGDGRSGCHVAARDNRRRSSHAKDRRSGTANPIFARGFRCDASPVYVSPGYRRSAEADCAADAGRRLCATARADEGRGFRGRCARIADAIYRREGKMAVQEESHHLYVRLAASWCHHRHPDDVGPDPKVTVPRSGHTEVSP